MPRKGPASRLDVRRRLRRVREGGIVLGSGKAALLEAIGRTGSIRAAASALGVSYTRAWSLVRVRNAELCAPLVVSELGGPRHGRRAHR